MTSAEIAVSLSVDLLRRTRQAVRRGRAPTVSAHVAAALRARAAGQLCGTSGTRDVIDASVVRCARARGQGVVTTDVDDMRRLDPRPRLVSL